MLADVGDLDDVLVVERGREARLRQEHVDHGAIGGVLRAQALDRDVSHEALGTGDAREQQLGHIRAREILDDLVATQAVTDGADRGHHYEACAGRPCRVKKAFPALTQRSEARLLEA